MKNSLREPVSYVFYYTNGTSRVHYFENDLHYRFFLHHEGDHVVETKRFFPKEQNEEDYTKTS